MMSLASVPSRIHTPLPAAITSCGPDRRVHDRHAQPPLHVSCIPGGVTDVSLGGIGLTLAAPVPAHTLCELIVTEGLCYTTQTLAAEVVWRSGNRVGLRWIDPSAGELKWLRESIERWKVDRASAVTASPI